MFRNCNLTKLLVVYLLCVAVYFVSTLFVPVVETIKLLDAGFISVGILVTCIYAPLFLTNAVERKLDRVGILVIGVVLLWFSYLGSRSVFAAYLKFGDLNGAANNKFQGLFVMTSLFAAVLYAVAPGYPPEIGTGKFGGRYRWYLIAAAALGLGIALAL